MLLGPRASLNTRHVHCFSKKPWCWINAKVKLSVLRCGQVELFLSFQVRFECSSSLLIIKQGKYRKLKDEIDDFDFDDVVQQCLFLFMLFMPQKFVHSVDNKHVHTIVLPSRAHSLHFTSFFSYYNVSAFVLFRYAGTHALTFYVEVIRSLKHPYP